MYKLYNLINVYSISINYMDINVELIDQRLSQLRALIPRFRKYLTAAEIRVANKIITWELKRIQAIHALKKKLGDLRNLIPLYKAQFPANEHGLADQIINGLLRSNSFQQNHNHPYHIYPHHITLHCNNQNRKKHNHTIWSQFPVITIKRFQMSIGN